LPPHHWLRISSRWMTCQRVHHDAASGSCIPSSPLLWSGWSGYCKCFGQDANLPIGLLAIERLKKVQTVLALGPRQCFDPSSQWSISESLEPHATNEDGHPLAAVRYIIVLPLFRSQVSFASRLSVANIRSGATYW
jgi:hypothetical protein